MVTAATLRVPETRAELIMVAGRGVKGRRPTVVGTAGSETHAELAVAGRGAKGRRPTVVGTAGSETRARSNSGG